MKVKAIVKNKREAGAEFTDFELPEMGPNDVRVKVAACAICGTDVHIYEWNDWAARTFEKSYGPLPRVLGHEFSGDVVETGKNVTKVKVGDRIAAETHIPCGSCFLCRTGKQYNCQNVKRFKTGVFAEYAVIPDFSAEIVPENIPYQTASLFEPFGVAVHAVSYVRMVGDTVAVVGAGPIGLFVAHLAKTMGAAKVFITDVSEYRLELAKKIGADVAINVKNDDPVALIKDSTSGLGAGVVIETSGNVKAVKQGFEILRKNGSLCMVGLPSEPLVLDAGPDIVWKAAVVYGIHGRDTFTSWEIAKNLLSSGRVSLEPFITHRFPFKDFKGGFDLAVAGNSGKVLLLPE
ncbi:MAG: alcohol dehydrogenase catalytic domain-containing protein [Spirochaetaceae bacterium]|nr:alcohol dehydrogenase catalytic domain-containing protein [Spirochaetaceae bacterium]